MFGQNEASINYRIVQQSIETNKTLLDDMNKRVKENEMLKAKAPNNIRIIDYAMAPTEPVDSKRLPYLGLAFLLSLTTGVGLALFRDYFDDSVHSIDEIEETLSLPALAVIPKVGRGVLRDRRLSATTSIAGPANEPSLLDQPVAEGNAELLFNTDPQSPLAEAFRRLRTALVLSPSVGEIKKILVTSSQQAEGKTTTAVNVAASLMQTGAKVLIIDADMRSPQIHRIFDLSNDTGLSDVFLRDIEPAELFTKIIRQSNSLYVLTAGVEPMNSAECMGSDRMRELIKHCEPVFDYIVIDSPPVIDFVDSTILASLVDGVLLVVEGNRSSRKMVRHSAKLLRMVGANIAGIVLNKMSMPSRKYYYRTDN
jgi:capsular exopolysaccharide synthesis family protein